MRSHASLIQVLLVVLLAFVQFSTSSAAQAEAPALVPESERELMRAEADYLNSGITTSAPAGSPTLRDLREGALGGRMLEDKMTIRNTLSLSKKCVPGNFQKKQLAFSGFSAEEFVTVLDDFADTCSSSSSTQELYDCIALVYNTTFDHNPTLLTVSELGDRSVYSVDGAFWCVYFAGPSKSSCEAYQVILYDDEFTNF